MSLEMQASTQEIHTGENLYKCNVCDIYNVSRKKGANDFLL